MFILFVIFCPVMSLYLSFICSFFPFVFFTRLLLNISASFFSPIFSRCLLFILFHFDTTLFTSIFFYSTFRSIFYAATVRKLRSMQTILFHAAFVASSSTRVSPTWVQFDICFQFVQVFISHLSWLSLSLSLSSRFPFCLRHWHNMLQ